MMKLPEKHKYSLLRGTLLLLSPLFTVLSLFLKKNNNIVLTASLNKEFSDNSRALFEALYQHPDYHARVYFVINDNDKANALNQQYPNRFLSNTKLANIIFILRAKHWLCSALEMPAPALFQRRQRTVIHLGHGMLYKKIGLRESEVSWYKKLYYRLITSNISYTIATTPFFQAEIAQGFGLPNERVKLFPQPKTAQIANPEPMAEPLFHNPQILNVLYAPTWRPYGAVTLFPFADFNLQQLNQFLAENNIYIWLRVHPRHEQFIDSALLNASHIKLFSAKQYSEINKYLAYFGALITDYSSIYFDYLTLERPVLFFDYDLEQYHQKVGLIDTYQQIKCTPSTTSQESLMQQLEHIKQGEFALENIQRINKITNYNIANHQIFDKVINHFFNEQQTITR